MSSSDDEEHSRGREANASPTFGEEGRLSFESNDRRTLLSPRNDDATVPATPEQANATEGVSNSSVRQSPSIDVEGDIDQSDESDEEANSSIRGRHQDDEGEIQNVDDSQTLARGTNVDIRVAAATFRDFLRNFRALPISSDSSDDDSEMDDTSSSPPLYLERLESLADHTAPSSLDIDTMHLYYHNEACQKLYHQLVHYPMELVPLFDLVVQKELQRIVDLEQHQIPAIQVRPYNLKEVSNLRCLDPVAMDSMVCLKGMIVRCSPIIPDLKVAHFRCVICGHDHQVAIDRGRINEPAQCSGCHTKDSYQLLHNRSVYADKQLVRLQETPDQVPAGQTPASAVTFCFDDLVDKCQPGDKVEVVGILRAQPVRVNPKLTKLKSIYKTYVDVIHFRTVTGMEREKGKYASTNLSKERIAHLRSIANRPDIYAQLTQSLAPSIWELDNVKKGVLCMLFGGNSRRVRRNSTVADHVDVETDVGTEEDVDDSDEEVKLSKRGDINILLCGDPGTSKSQLLSYVHKLSSRGVYTSGKGSSAVGLTASVVRDPETRDLVLESGALVLSDRGICCIDEFDKMSDATRSILHEAMEQQTVSIAKAGIIASLNARTSILASANPLESRYNPNLSVVENIRLPPTLLSRFDLIYLILDSPNVDQDRQLAQHLVGLYHAVPSVIKPPLETDLLKDYIDYAREHVHPSLSDEAVDQLLASYLEMRNPPGGNIGNNGTRTISATPRQLESLIRTSEALAKMRYAPTVTREDAKEAVRLLKVATQAAATDPRTGRIDMDMINTGRSVLDRELEEGIYIGLKEYLTERRGRRLALRDVVNHLSEVSNQAVSNDDISGALHQMEADGFLQFNERTQSVFVRTGLGT